MNPTSISIFDNILVENDVNTWKDIWGNNVRQGSPVITIKTDRKGIPQHVARVVQRDPWKRYKSTGQTQVRLISPHAFANEVISRTTENKIVYESNRKLFNTYYRKLLDKGCDNPHCIKHRNGWWVIQNNPKLKDLDESVSIPIAGSCFEWNHKDPTLKEYSIAELRGKVLQAKNPERQKYWFSVMSKEILKCELLCTECHRIETNIERHHAKQINADVETYEDFCKLNNIKCDDELYTKWKLLGS